MSYEAKDATQRWTVLGLLLAAIVLSLLLVACRGQVSAGGDLKVNLTMVPEPPKVGPAEITVVMTEASGAPVGGAAVEVVGDMSHAGMVPVRTQAKEVSAGRYVTGGFEFTMAGDWILTVRATPSGGQQFERTFSVSVPAGDQAPAGQPMKGMP